MHFKSLFEHSMWSLSRQTSRLSKIVAKRRCQDGCRMVRLVYKDFDGLSDPFSTDDSHISETHLVQIICLLWIILDHLK